MRETEGYMEHVIHVMDILMDEAQYSIQDNYHTYEKHVTKSTKATLEYKYIWKIKLQHPIPID